MGKFSCINTTFPGVLILKPTVFEDSRGFFLESYNKLEYAELGISEEFVQDNVSHSKRGVVRGLHYQYGQPQGKLVRVLQGAIFDAVVDIRVGSPNYGKYFGTGLTAEDQRMLYVPIGYAHGFMVLEDDTEVMYKVTDYYAPHLEAGICWNDPDIGIAWPLGNKEDDNLSVSQKDAILPLLKDIRSPFVYQEKQQP